MLCLFNFKLFVVLVVYLEDKCFVCYQRLLSAFVYYKLYLDKNMLFSDYIETTYIACTNLQWLGHAHNTETTPRARHTTRYRLTFRSSVKHHDVGPSWMEKIIIKPTFLTSTCFSLQLDTEEKTWSTGCKIQHPCQGVASHYPVVLTLKALVVAHIGSTVAQVFNNFFYYCKR